MSISGSWVFNPCNTTKRLYPELDVKEIEKIDKRLDEVVKKHFTDNPTLKKFGWNNDAEEFVNRFQDATGKHIELHQPTMSDVRVFKSYMKSWTKEIEKGFRTSFHSWKILPQKLRKLPLGEKTYRNLLDIMSYERNHKQRAQASLGKITKDMTALAGKKLFNVDTKRLSELESMIMSTNDKNEIETIYNEIQKELGSKSDINARTRAGDLFYGMRDVMEGMNAGQLRKQGPAGKVIPWSAQEQALATSIQNEWIRQRKDLSLVALNALNMEKRFAKRLDLRENHARGLEKFLDTIENKIKELEMTGKAGDDPRYDIDNRELVTIGEKDKRLVKKDYMPHQVLTIVKNLEIFHDWMEADNPSMKVTATEKFKDLILSSDRGFIDRLKSRGEHGEEYYSRNPLFFLSQYIHDITRYNYKRSIETVLVDTYDKLIKSKEFAKEHNSIESEQVMRFVDEAIGTLNNIAEESIVTNGNSNMRSQRLSRLLTTLGFIRTMAYNVRSPMKNYTQKYFEYMDLGARAPRVARAYMQGNKDIENAMTDAKARHGLYWKTDDSFIKELTSSYHTAAATRGSKESEMLPPGMAEVGGKIMIVNENAFDRTLRVLDKVADIGAWGHRKVEDVIRAHAFVTGYGLAHKNLSELPDWFISKEMGRTEATHKERRAWIDRAAGNLAYGKVIDIHYEYSTLQKPDLIKGPVGSVIGQYKQYRFSNLDMQWNWIKAGKRRILSGGLADYEAVRLYRLGVGYSIAGGLTAALGLGFSNLFQNDSYEWLKGYFDYWTADRTTKEGREKAKKALFGKGELGELGPSFGTFIETMELFNLMKIDHSHRLAILGITNDISPVKSVNDMDRNYRLARLVNLQGARSWFHTREALLNKQYWRSFLTETGLYGDRDSQESSDTFMKWVRRRTGTKTYEKRSDRRRRQRMLKELSPSYAAAVKSLDTYLR